MKIGLIDVDGHNGFPNLALMKISSYHKSIGDSVEWYDSMFSDDMDKVYMSKIFTFTQDYNLPIRADDIEFGGTGYKDYLNVLSENIENMFPDYSLYPNFNQAIGFITRGCPNKCKWCVVPKKEGMIRPNMRWDEIARKDSNKITFLDNNILASDFGISQIEELGNTKYYIDFNQGLDCRKVDKEIASILAKCKWQNYIRFACDTQSQLPYLEQAIRYLREAGYSKRDVFVYTIIQNVDESLDRINKVMKLGGLPFAQPYRDFDSMEEPTSEQKTLANWCNKKMISRFTPFEEFRKSVDKNQIQIGD